MKKAKSKYADLVSELKEIFATKEDLSTFATKEDLNAFATKKDLLTFKDAIIVAVEDFNSTTIKLSEDLQFDSTVRLNNHDARIEKIEEKVFS